jgi:histidinol-phosphate aminotransferase
MADKAFKIGRRSFLGGSAFLAGATSVPVLGSTSGNLIASVAASTATEPLYGPPPGVAKLNANENPYGPSPLAIKAMTKAISKGAYYVNETAQLLKQMIAQRHGLTVDHILLSSGSSGVLTNLAMAAASEGNILGADLFWDTTSKMGTRNSKYGIKRLAKTVDLSIDLEAMLESIGPDIALAQVCNPNNPTGMMLPAEKLKSFCKAASNKTMVLVDEAYNELTDDPESNSVVPLIKSGYNVVVARTFSKIYGLAGMRVGYMIASPETIEKISKFGMGSYGLNQAGIAAAVASYNDEVFLKHSKAKVVEARQMVSEAVTANGLKALPSQTSFMFVDLGDLNAETFRQEMAKENVLIRGIYQDYTNWSRVSMGKIPDVQKYIDNLPKVIDRIS